MAVLGCVQPFQAQEYFMLAAVVGAAMIQSV